MHTNYMYNSQNIEEQIDTLYAAMSEKRKNHTEGVIETAKRLARLYGEDIGKAAFSAKCHDFFRGKDNSYLNDLIEKYDLPSRYKDNPNLSHSKIAACFLEIDLGIDDRDIINAVSFHTTGRRGMSLLEKIVFIADAIEPGRSYPDVEEIRETAFKNIDKACLMSLQGNIRHLEDMNAQYIDKDTLDAAEFFKSAEKEN